MFTDESKQRTDSKKYDVNIKMLIPIHHIKIMFLLQCFYPNVRCTLLAGCSTGNGRGHISMIFSPRLQHHSDIPEKVIPVSCDTLMDIFKVAYQFLAGLHC